MASQVGMSNLNLFTSNRLEILAESLAEVLRTPLSSPLEPEIIVIQSLGMERWLSMELARYHGICANYDFPFPNIFVHQVFKQVLPDMPEHSPYTPEVLTWKIMKNLPTLLDRPEFENLRIYLENDRGDLKRFQLSERIADLFDQYLLFRPEMIFQWEKGGGRHWQALFWRDLIKGHEGEHRAALAKDFFQKLKEASVESGRLPERVSVFGISALPPFHLQVLAGISRFTQVNLFLMNPCKEYWGDILSDQEIKRTKALEGREEQEPDSLHIEKGNSILASMGTLGRDFFDMISELGCEEYHTFEEPGEKTLLTSLQTDILHLYERGRNGKSQVSSEDKSIRIHSCHSPMREIEVLKDQLLQMFDEDQDLKPKDILVMTPDIETYAPYIQAVFDTSHGDSTWIPFSIADRSIRNESEIIEPFMAILRLWEGRFGIAQVLSVLESASVRRKFNVSETDLDLIRRWVIETRIRWGIDGESRTRLDLPEFKENTWKAGLERLLLGYAMPGDDENLFKDLLPYDNIEGSETQVLGNLIEFTERLFKAVRSFLQPKSLEGWFRILTSLLEDFFEPDEETEREVQILRRILRELVLMSENENPAFKEAVSIRVIRSYLGHTLERKGFGFGFITGGVTFGALLPMRSIPFKIICLIGMDHDAYPRESKPLGFDFMSRYPRRGDRSRRHDDRYLFLEAILSARQVFYVSYIGQSARDNSQIPPSVLVSELTDTIEQGFETTHQDILEHIMTRHRLQAFSPSYFSKGEKLFSYSEENCRAAQSLLGSHELPGPFITEMLPDLDDVWKQITLDDLSRFYSNPAKFLLNRRLGIRLDEGPPILEEREPFDIEGLERYLFEEQLLARRMSGKGLEDFSVVAKASGQLPPGTVGTCRYGDLSQGIEDFFERTGAYIDSGPLESLDVDIDLADFRLMGKIAGLYPDRLLRYRYARVRAADRITAWIYHLALNAIKGNQHPKISLLVGLNQERSWAAWKLSPVEKSETILKELLEIYWAGLIKPLHFFPESSWTFVRETLEKKRSHDEARLTAQKTWLGSAYKRGEFEDAYYQLCFKNTDPVDREFQRISTKIFGPLYLHQSEAGK